MEAKNLTYPVLLFRDGYVYLANNVSELCTHDRGTYSETRQSRWRIVDSNGRCGDVVRWEELPRSRGPTALIKSFLGGVSAKPIIEIRQTKTVAETIQEIEPMLLQYGMYGNAYGTNREAFLEDLRRVSSFRALFEFVVSAV